MRTESYRFHEPQRIRRALRRCVLASACVLPAYLAFAGTLYVDSASGRDSNGGSSLQDAYRSIQRAADRAEPGDIVLVQPGIYFESVRVAGRGTADNPIIFRAVNGEEGTVVISGADSEIRGKRVLWEPVSPSNGLYRIACSCGWPARVLADGLDLYPYGNRAELTQFTTHAGPGPKRGYAYEPAEQMLYVRLHADENGNYPDPREHLVCVAPPTGEGFDGTLIRKPSDYNFAIIGNDPAYVVIEGFTFETPGVAGVYVESDHVTVRDCWFIGCRTGVSGNYQEEFYDESVGADDYFNLRHTAAATERAAANVVVEYCSFTQKPVMEDIRELIGPSAVWPGGKKDRFALMWHRKVQGYGLPSDKFKYETGIICRAGRNWTVRRNRIQDAFEGLSSHSVSGSENLSVLENVFCEIADNAVETEDHSQGMLIAGNFMIDCLEPISLQPLRGLPWPGSITVKENVIMNREFEWPEELVQRSAFKIGMSPRNWSLPQIQSEMAPVPQSPLRLPGSGMLVYSNTVYFPGGSVCKMIGKRGTQIENVVFSNNLFVADSLVPPDQKIAPDTFRFVGNTVASASANEFKDGSIAAGDGGTVCTSPHEFVKPESLPPAGPRCGKLTETGSVFEKSFQP